MRRLAAVVLAVLVAGCGSTVAPSPSPAASPTARPTPTPRPTPRPTPATTAVEIAAAAEHTVGTGAVALEFALRFEGSTLIGDGLGMTGTGEAGFGERRQAVLDADMRNLGVGRIEMILDDRLIYMRGDAFKAIGADRDWLVVDLDSDHPAVKNFANLATGQNDMSLAVFYLHGAVGQIRFLRTETVRGVSADRYGLTLDLEEAVERVPPSARETLQANIRQLLESGIRPRIDAEVAIGADGFVHAVTYGYTLGATMGGGTMIGEYEFFDFGKPLVLHIPAEADTVPIEDVMPASPAPG